MRKYILVATLLVVIAALALTAAMVTGDAGAFPTWGDDNNCDASGCHQTNSFGDGVHQIEGHSTIVGDCGNCHEGGTSAGEVTPEACLDCHGGGTTSGLISEHPDGIQENCNQSGCHGVATTTTTEGPTTTTTEGPTTTTTEGPTTTTTEGPTTTTTEGPTTTTTEVDTTTTTERPTTTTTVPTAQPRFTG